MKASDTEPAYKDTLPVLQPGTLVEVGLPNERVPGVIIAVMVEARLAVSYKVAWYDGRNRNEQWSATRTKRSD